MKYFTLVLITLLFVSCQNKTQNVADVIEEKEQISTQEYNLEVYDFEGLKPFLSKNDDKTYVVNFWATWCAPCIKELPYFEDIKKKYESQGVEVLLVSLDFPNQYEKRLLPFIKKNNLQSKVIAFDDVDQNTWIPAINKNWTGALPATIIYNKNNRKFYERSFTYKELENELQQFLKL